jgi:hypothetical protein
MVERLPPPFAISIHLDAKVVRSTDLAGMGWEAGGRGE